MFHGKRLIGLHSPAPQSGKSTIATALSSQPGWKRESIAGGIREMADKMGFPSASYAGNDRKDLPDPLLGGRTPRQVLINIGQAMREIHGPDYWTNFLALKIEKLPKIDHTIVIDDIRTEQDGEFVLSNGGIVITIIRDSAVFNPNDVMGFTPVVSVSNNGTIEQCLSEVRSLIDRHYE